AFGNARLVRDGNVALSKLQSLAHWLSQGCEDGADGSERNFEQEHVPKELQHDAEWDKYSWCKKRIASILSLNTGANEVGPGAKAEGSFPSIDSPDGRAVSVLAHRLVNELEWRFLKAGFVIHNLDRVVGFDEAVLRETRPEDIDGSGRGTHGIQRSPQELHQQAVAPGVES
ncbi:unnamed protein product, partial [Amoebophrya sp. A25]